MGDFIYGTKFLTGDYSKVAAGLGAYSERIDRPGEIVPAFERAAKQTREGRPVLLELITGEEADIPRAPWFESW